MLPVSVRKNRRRRKAHHRVPRKKTAARPVRRLRGSLRQKRKRARVAVDAIGLAQGAVSAITPTSANTSDMQMRQALLLGLSFNLYRLTPAFLCAAEKMYRYSCHMRVGPKAAPSGDGLGDHHQHRIIHNRFSSKRAGSLPVTVFANQARQIKHRRYRRDHAARHRAAQRMIGIPSLICGSSNLHGEHCVRIAANHH
jgi:hypothetical protein